MSQNTSNHALTTHSATRITEAAPTLTIPSGSMNRRGIGNMRRHYLLGEGGSGGQATMYRKQRAAQSYGPVDLNQYLRCLVVDNDTRLRDKFMPDEFELWGEIHLADFLRAKLKNPQEFPSLDRFGELKAHLEDLKTVGVLKNGCRGNRAYGGMAHVYRAHTVGISMIDQLIHPILALFGQKDEEATNGLADADQHSTLIVNQAYSAGGAKGNTAALVTAWLIHQQLKTLGLTNFRLDVTMYLAETFNTSGQERIRANTHAFLLELKAIYEQALPDIPFGPFTIERTPPYTLIKLCNGVNDKRVYSQDEVYQIEAACWQCSNIGPMADQLESLIPNIVDEIRWPNIAYSQNMYSLILPVEELMTDFGMRLAVETIDAHLLRKPEKTDPIESTRYSRSWMKQFQLTPKGVSGLFAKGRNGQELAVDVRSFKKLPFAKLQAAINAYEHAHVTQWQREIGQLAEHHANQLQDELNASLQALIQEPRNGLLGTINILGTRDDALEQATLTSFIQDLKRTLIRQQQQTEAAHNRVREQLIKPAPRMKRWFTQLVPGARRRLWFKRKQTELGLRLTLLKLAGQIQLVSRIEQHVSAHHTALTNWRVGLEQTSLRLKRKSQQYNQDRRQRPVFEESILNATEESQLYQQSLSAAFQLAVQRVRIAMTDNIDREPRTWELGLAISDTKETIGLDSMMQAKGLELLSAFGTQFFVHLNDMNIEHVLSEQQREPRVIVETMLEQASPLIAIDRVAHELQRPAGAASLRQEVILGCPNGASGFFNGTTRTGMHVVACTYQPHKIELLNSIFHINPFALAQSEEYARAYQTAKAAGQPLHIFDESELQPKATKSRRGRKPRKSTKPLTVVAGEPS